MLIPNKHSGYLAGQRLYPKKDAPGPDPQIGQATLRQIALAEKQWDEYTKFGGDRDWLRGITDRAVSTYENTQATANDLADYQLGMMRRNDERYQNVAIPFENRLLEDVNRFDSQAYKDQQAGLAMADVNQAFDSVRGQNARGLTRMGVNPNDGKFAAMQNQTGIAQAAAMANAANKTRMAADQVGLSTKMQMYGGMKGLAGLGATNAGLATGAMGTGMSGAQGMMGAGTGMIGANNNTFGSTMNGMSQGINGGINFANAQTNAANVEGEMWGAILGAGARLGSAAIVRGSDRRLKENIHLVGVDERTGLNLYEFTYKGGDGTRFVGVMADEVEQVMPEAVYTMPDGYKAVNYAALGIEMVAVKE